MESQGLSLFDMILKGGIIMIPIGILSLLSIYVVIERFIYINQAFKIEDNFIPNLRDLLTFWLIL
jgi:biopolymer transport protein ExbB